jgi:hypothetical protein
MTTNDWVELTISNGHFLDEITAALRDARIELRLSAPLEAPERGARTSFGVAIDKSKVIEVPRDQLADARALLREIFDDAEAAALRQSGAPTPTATERDEEAVWRAEIERKRQRSARRVRLVVRAIMATIALAVLVSLLLAAFRP